MEFTEESDEIEMPAKKRSLSKGKKVIPNQKKKNPMYINSPKDEQHIAIEAIKKKISGKNPYEFFLCTSMTMYCNQL